MSKVSDAAIKLKALRESAGISYREAAAALNPDAPASSYQHYETRYKKPHLPVELVRKLVPLFAQRGVSEKELYALTGLKPGAAGQELAPTESDTHRIPVIDYVQAGRWAAMQDPYAEGWGADFIDAGSGLGPRTFALEIRGKSMEPDFHEGDRVVIDPDVSPRPGDFVVAKLDGQNEATFKKYRYRGKDAKGIDIIELVPLNNDFPVLVLDRKNPGQIVGTMMEHRRYRR